MSPVPCTRDNICEVAKKAFAEGGPEYEKLCTWKMSERTLAWLKGQDQDEFPLANWDGFQIWGIKVTQDNTAPDGELSLVYSGPQPQSWVLIVPEPAVPVAQ